MTLGNRKEQQPRGQLDKRSSPAEQMWTWQISQKGSYLVFWLLKVIYLNLPSGF